MKLLVDMNLSPRWVSKLASEGFEAVHWSSVGNANAMDSDIMRFALQNDFVVLTYDLDFSAILAVTHGEKPSVVQLRIDDLSLEGAGARVISTLKQIQPELERGALVSIGSQRTRVRLLPLVSRGQHS